jgi:hypothetical protein
MRTLSRSIHARGLMALLIGLLTASGCGTTIEHQYDDEQVREFSRRICDSVGPTPGRWVLGHYPVTPPTKRHLDARWRLRPPTAFVARGGTLKTGELIVPPDTQRDRYIYPFELVHDGRRLPLDCCECLYAQHLEGTASFDR